MAVAKFIYDSADRCPDLYYATKFHAPDAFIYFETRGKKYLVMNDLEIDRARKEARVGKVLSLSAYMKKAAQKQEKPSRLDILDAIFHDFRIKTLEMPPNAAFGLVDQLRKRHYKVVAGHFPFYPGRLKKTPEERKAIASAQKTVFTVMAMAEKILRSSVIKKNYLYYKGEILTSETVREMINVELLRREFIVTEGTIVACGRDTVDPHNYGKGPLSPHEAIIVDIFPKSMETLYYGDATRTFCVGKAPDKLKKLYNAVKIAQGWALKTIRAGVNGRTIHEGILKLFDSHGFKTGEKDGHMQGFFHGTGHGIGLDLHEEPVRINPSDFTLEEGFVTSVEPGLYYKGIGGVRIEDLVYITKNGCEVLSNYPKRLEIL